MKKWFPKYIFLILVYSICFVTCEKGKITEPDSIYIYSRPEQTDDGWQTATLGEVGIEIGTIGETIQRINSNTYQNVHSILIVKNGYLVFEEYFEGYTFDYNGNQYRGDLVEFDKNTIHNLASVTKSFTSSLIGIAIDHGMIESVEKKVFDFFPEYSHLQNESNDRITLEHLLSMTSGWQWNEWEYSLSDTRNDLIQLFYVSDPVEYVLSKPVIHEPGTSFYYNGGGTNILGEVIRSASEFRIDIFSGPYLFDFLGITDYEWDFINSNLVHASGNLKLRPRDMAKLGYLFLNNGVWAGNRIISEQWVERSTREYISLYGISWATGYGYQWWRKRYNVNSTIVDAFSAEGWGGQQINVFPDLNMVVVFTGGNYASSVPNDEILSRYILPAVF